MSSLAIFMDGRRGRLSSLLALLALLIGLVVSAVQPLLPRDGVEDVAPFVSAVRAKAAELRAGDTVLVHPPWRHDVVTALEQAGLLPRGVKATVALGLAHGKDPGRVLVVADAGAPPLPRSRRRQLGVVERVAGLEVAWLSGPGAAATSTSASDLGAQVALARVHVERSDGSLVKCTWDDDRARHTCLGLPEWMYVGAEAQMVAGHPTRCVWSHPITGGKVVIRYDGVRLRDKLHFAHALADTAAGKAGGAPVTAEVLVDGRSLGRSKRSNQAGFARKIFEVPSRGEPAALTLEITTPNDGARHYCWTLTTTSDDAVDEGAKP